MSELKEKIDVLQKCFDNIMGEDPGKDSSYHGGFIKGFHAALQVLKMKKEDDTKGEVKETLEMA